MLDIYKEAARAGYTAVWRQSEPRDKVSQWADLPPGLQDTYKNWTMACLNDPGYRPLFSDYLQAWTQSITSFKTVWKLWRMDHCPWTPPQLSPLNVLKYPANIMLFLTAARRSLDANG